jgi:hypothetical protein
MLPFASLLLLAPAQAAAPPQDLPEVDAKTLPGVPGPLVPHYPDPSRGPGSDSMEAALRIRARRGVNIPAVALPPGSLRLKDHIADLSGWRAYRIEVPAGGGFKVRLHGVHEAWFVVKVLNRWGALEEGMLQNRIPTGNPEASYRNPKAGTATVFIVVDTTMTSVQGEEYTLTVTRN